MSTVEARAERIAEVVADYLRAVVAGTPADDEVWAQQHQELLPELAEALRKARLFRAAYELALTPARDETTVDVEGFSARDLPDSSLRIRCPHCHVLQEVAGDDAASTLACAACGSRFSLVEDETADPARSPRRVAHFTLLERLGSGGFGAVWKARDEQLDRLVALKLPRRGQLSAAEAELFLREARAAAQLHHPGIVSIYEVGREGDSIYIVSELVEGVSLAEWLADQRMSARESAELCVKIAEALDHAHHHGVIHRDLKPANVLLDADGQPHITDFGLARRETGEVTMTCDGQLLGTPAYMSPEQARGDSHTSDARSDIYALGVMLYELLTGEVPFRGGTATLLHQAIHDDPPSPRKLNARVPRDLETITLKCLEKEPARRYDTADELESDLRHYLHGEPIHSRPVGRLERSWRWCKRRPAVAGLGALAASLLVILAVAASLVAWREALRRHEAVAQQRSLRRQLYGVDMDSAMHAWQDAKIAEVETTLNHWRPEPEREDLRGFEWYYLWRSCQRGRDAPTYVHSRTLDDCLAYTRDGRYIACVQKDYFYVLLDAHTAAVVRREQLPFREASWIELSPDGSVVAASGAVDGVSFVRLWRLLPTLAELPLDGPRPAVRRLVFSDDGGLFAAENIDGTVQFWDVATGKSAGRLESGILGSERTRVSGFNILAIAADHRLAAVVVDQVQLSLWDLAEARKLHDLSGHGARVDTAVFSPDGAQLATGGWDGTVRLWNSTTGALIHTLTGHAAGILRVAFSSNGVRVISSSGDHTVRVWDVAQGVELETLRGHNEPVAYVAIAPGGTSVASHSTDNVTKIWRVDQPNRRELLTGHRIYVSCVALAPNGKKIVSGDTNGEIRIWDVATASQVGILLDHPDRVQNLDFSPDGRLLVSTCSGRSIVVWETANWKPTKRFETTSAVPCMSLFSPDGRSLVSVLDDGTVSCRHVGDVFEEFHRFDTGLPGVTSLAIAPNRTELATGHPNGDIKLWKLDSSHCLQTLTGHRRRIRHLEFSPDGSLLASSDEGGEIRLWDTTTRQLRVAPMRRFAEVFCARFFPDGNTLVSCELGPDICLWDVRSGAKRGVLRGSGEGFNDLAISKTGMLLVTGDGDFKVRLWRAASRAEVQAADKH